MGWRLTLRGCYLFGSALTRDLIAHKFLYDAGDFGAWYGRDARQHMRGIEQCYMHGRQLQ